MMKQVGSGSDSSGRSARQVETIRRRVFGTLLGGALGIGFSLGFFDVWVWLYTLGLPVRLEPGSFLPRDFIGFLIMLLIGTLSLVFGLLIAWPQQWRRLIWALFAYFAIVLLILWPSPLTALMALAAPVVIRGEMKLLLLASRRWGRAGYLALFVAVLLSAFLGLALTHPLASLDYPRVQVLWAAHYQAQREGWEGYTLELEMVDSSMATVLIHLPDGETRTCYISAFGLMGTPPLPPLIFSTPTPSLFQPGADCQP